MMLTIHGLDKDLYAALCRRAARHGRTPSSEAHEILRRTLTRDASLSARIAGLLADLDDPSSEAQ